MNRRARTDEYEEQDGFISRLYYKLFPDADEEEEDELPSAERAGARKKQTANGTLLQVHAHRGSQISKRAPTSLADAERAAMDLMERRPVIVNLEKADDELARRVIDFIVGVTYALNGFYERVGNNVFLFTPSNIIIADEDEVEPGGKGLYSEDDYDS